MKPALRQIFLRHWLLPFFIVVIGWGVLFGCYFLYRYRSTIVTDPAIPARYIAELWLLNTASFAIAGLNLAAFTAGALAGRALTQYWRRLPLKLLKYYTLVIILFAVAGWWLYSYAAPHIGAYKAARMYDMTIVPEGKRYQGGPVDVTPFRNNVTNANNAALQASRDSLQREAWGKQERIITTLANAPQKEAADAYYTLRLWELGIGREAAQKAGTGNNAGQQVDLIDLANTARQLQRLRYEITARQQELWKRHLLPFYMVLFHTIGFLAGALLFYKRPMLLLFFLPVAGYTLLMLLSIAAAALLKTENFIMYLLPLLLLLLACIILYGLLRRKLAKPAHNSYI